MYTNSVVCISTAVAASAKGNSFRTRNVGITQPIAMKTILGSLMIIPIDLPYLGFRGSRLASRGWEFQERILSPRVLILGREQVFWECRNTEHNCVSESFLSGIAGAFPDDDRGPFSLSTALKDSDLVSWCQKFWIRFVEEKSYRQLTKVDEDKLTLFAGIAQRSEGILRNSPYVAGFFEIEFPRCLYSEERSDPNAKCRTQPTCFRAPSWNWAASDRPITIGRFHRTFKGGITHNLVVLKSYSVHLVDGSNPFGQLKCASITLFGPILATLSSNLESRRLVCKDPNADKKYELTAHYDYTESGSFAEEHCDGIIMPILHKGHHTSHMLLYGLILCPVHETGNAKREELKNRKKLNAILIRCQCQMWTSIQKNTLGRGLGPRFALSAANKSISQIWFIH